MNEKEKEKEKEEREKRLIKALEQLPVINPTSEFIHDLFPHLTGDEVYSCVVQAQYETVYVAIPISYKDSFECFVSVKFMEEYIIYGIPYLNLNKQLKEIDFRFAESILYKEKALVYLRELKKNGAV